MRSDKSGRWLALAPVPVIFAALALYMFVQGEYVIFTFYIVAFTMIMWWVWPNRSGNHVSHQDAQKSETTKVIIYWRPG